MNKLWDTRLIEVNPFSRPGQKLESVEFLVYHYTANPGASAENHFNYFLGLKNQNPHDKYEDTYASAHLFIDRDSALEIIPLEEKAYHAGNRWYNACSIGIELCIEKDGTFHHNTIKRAIEIGAYLCGKYKIDPIQRQIRHYDVTGKLCPKPWVLVPSLFKAFKLDVAAAMKGEYVMRPEDANKIIATYLQPAWMTAHQNGDDEGKKEAARLADELRKTSNQAAKNS